MKDNINSSRSSERELNELFNFSSDSFDKVVSDNTIHKIDISSTHPFNNERLKYYENGAHTDFFNSANTTDDPSKWVITAPAGDTLTIESRQRLRYVPGYELFYGTAWYAESNLTEGQKIIVSLGNGEDAFRAVYTPQGQQNEYRLVRNSSVVETVGFTSPVPVTQPQIDQGKTNMYGVGATQLFKNYLDQNFNQSTELLAKIGDINNVVTEEFNLKLRITIDNADGTEPRTLNVMSMQAQDFGNAEPLVRTKAFTEWDLGGTIDDTSWTPILALRKDNDQPSILYNLKTLTIIPSDTMQVSAIAVSPDQTDATGFTSPDSTNPENDVTEITRDVTTPTDPSVGRQEASATAVSQNVNQSKTERVNVLTPVYDDDVIVFMARTRSASNASTDLVVRSEQEW